ncbi:transmembrane protein 106C-like isoform X2 [Chiloscyllium plagiosum]|uniref:transmembrane protein 106C-like isoform X2 n=1 Tax=Chiloscyllium plagiosum TaxID=36176 RepID=UPI001CB7BE0C|nr:transmembrane protein 106C-like isoform X2 [Chiloscyllium plagiosum]
MALLRLGLNGLFQRMTAHQQFDLGINRTRNSARCANSNADRLKETSASTSRGRATRLAHAQHNTLGLVNELVALIPYSDQRLQPQRTKLYVFISIFVCLLISGLVVFFLFPRSVVVTDDGIRVVLVKFDNNNSRVFIDMTSTLNISNSNFYTVSVDSLTCQVQYMKTVIGTKQLSNVSVIPPLSEKQVNYTVRMEFSGSLTYVYTFCTMPSIKVHNIVVFMQTTVKSSYLGHPSQNSLEAYRYLDCGSNSTVYRRPPLNH